MPKCNGDNRLSLKKTNNLAGPSSWHTRFSALLRMAGFMSMLMSYSSHRSKMAFAPPAFTCWAERVGTALRNRANNWVRERNYCRCYGLRSLVDAILFTQWKKYNQFVVYENGWAMFTFFFQSVLFTESWAEKALPTTKFPFSTAINLSKPSQLISS